MNAVIATSNGHDLARYDTVKQAERALRNARDRGHKIRGRRYSAEVLADAQVMTAQEFRDADVMVESKNLMSGATIMIPRSHKGTFMDPGCESYWTM
jgi:hypothetical protein